MINQLHGFYKLFQVRFCYLSECKSIFLWDYIESIYTSPIPWNDYLLLSQLWKQLCQTYLVVVPGSWVSRPEIHFSDTDSEQRPCEGWIEHPAEIHTEECVESSLTVFSVYLGTASSWFVICTCSFIYNQVTMDKEQKIWEEKNSFEWLQIKRGIGLLLKYESLVKCFFRRKISCRKKQQNTQGLPQSPV